MPVLPREWRSSLEQVHYQYQHMIISLRCIRIPVNLVYICVINRKNHAISIVILANVHSDNFRGLGNDENSNFAQPRTAPVTPQRRHRLSAVVRFHACGIQPAIVHDVYNDVHVLLGAWSIDNHARDPMQKR